MQRKYVFLCCQSFHCESCNEFSASDVMVLYEIINCLPLISFLSLKEIIIIIKKD